MTTSTSGAWLTESLLLLALDSELDVTTADETGAVASASVDGHEAPLRVEPLWSMGNGSGRSAGSILLAELPPDLPVGGQVTLRLGGRTMVMERKVHGAPPTDLTGLLRTRLSPLPQETREDLLERILDACVREHAQRGGDGGGIALSKNLRLLRDGLREPLPYATVGEDEALCHHVEEMLCIDSQTFWARGWVWDMDADLAGMRMVSPEGARAEILDRAFRYHRPDIDSMYVGRGVKDTANGFISCFEVDVPSRLTSGWIAELRDALGTAVEVEIGTLNRRPDQVRAIVARAVGDMPRRKYQLVADHAYPAIRRLQAAQEQATVVDEETSFGRHPPHPDVSLIVPLGDRLDVLEHQLGQFSRDADFERVDLIYVTDSHDHAHRLAPKAFELHEIYQVPFRLVLLSDRVGPTVTTNKAVERARASRLIFLSPDTFPSQSGWLGQLLAFHGEQRNAGAVGPKLLHEDGSLQHAGLQIEHVSPGEIGFGDLPDGGVLSLRSRFKGLPGSTPRATIGAEVPAVSGSCLLVDRGVFEEVGGLRNVFLEGENEDVDLCLRLSESGRANWYLPAVELYHLAGRSQPPVSKDAAQYNALLLTQLWRERLLGS